MYKVISHTADVGIDVSADSIEMLFIDAAKGWKHLIVEDSPTVAKDEQKIHFCAASLEDLLVQWLNELNFYLTVKEWILHGVVRCQIKRDDSDGSAGWTANFLISGEMLDYERHQIGIEIKSVTYHQLEIKEANNQYRTRIIFDI